MELAISQLGGSIEGDATPGQILDEEEGVLEHANSIEAQPGVDVGDASCPEVTTVGLHRPQRSAAVADPHPDLIVVEGEEVPVDDADLQADVDV